MLTVFPHPLFATPRSCVGRRCDPLFSARPLSSFGLIDAFRDFDEEMERLERAFFADDEEMPEATKPAPEAAADDEGRVEQVSLRLVLDGRILRRWPESCDAGLLLAASLDLRLDRSRLLQNFPVRRAPTDSLCSCR